MQIDPTWAGGIPLRRHDGTIRAFAWVDGEDYEKAAAFRWCMDGKHRYVIRYERTGTYIRQKRGRIYLHRFVLGLKREDKRKVDHINRNVLDNRKANLRFATDAQNAQNQGARKRTLKASRYRGVVWDKTRSKWRAQAVVDGRCHNLGRFDDELEAARVVAEFRREHMPFSEEAA